MKGFLGTGATFNADLNLVAQILMGAALLMGMMLARRKRYTAHGICQSTVVLLNLVLIAQIMWPSFRQTLPQLPAGLGERYYAVASLHAGLGTVAELLGLYIILVAGTRILPERLRFQNWKRWMRTELALWWAVVLIGAATYYVWYLAPQSKAAPQRASAAAAEVIVKVSNFEFAPKEVTVKPGATVAWVDEGGRHSVAADDGSFQSEVLTAGSRFEHKFDNPGTYAYYCGFHGGKGGKDMAGVVRVTK